MRDILKIENELNFLNSRFTTLLNLKLTVKSLDKSKALTKLLSRIAAKIILLNKKLAFINLKESDLRYKAVCRQTNKVEEHLLSKWCVFWRCFTVLLHSSIRFNYQHCWVINK